MSGRSNFQIASYSKNAVLQLIVITGVGFILYQMTWVSMVVFGVTYKNALALTEPAVGLPSIQEFAHHWWTIFTYGFIHNQGTAHGLFLWFSNMLWLFCFGNLVQSLIGYRQVIPIFIYGLIGGGIFYLLSQFIPNHYFHASQYLMTSEAGIMALAMACIALEPKYRFYLGEDFSIPLWIVFAAFLLLNGILGANGQVPALFLALGGLLTGFIYISFLKRGYYPGRWMYNISNAFNNLVTPKEQHSNRNKNGKRAQVLNSQNPNATQQQLDEILDKINQRGYNSLSSSEKEFLVKASKDGYQ